MASGGSVCCHLLSWPLAFPFICTCRLFLLRTLRCFTLSCVSFTGGFLINFYVSTLALALAFAFWLRMCIFLLPRFTWLFTSVLVVLEEIK